MKTEHMRETVMLTIRQFPDLVSKLPGISAHTLFVRAYCSFLRGRGEMGKEDFLVPVKPILQPGESGFVLSITRIMERFEMRDLHGQKRKLSLLSLCTAAWALH